MNIIHKNLKIGVVSLLFLFSLIVGGALLTLESFSHSPNSEEESIHLSQTIDPISIDGNEELATHPKINGLGTWNSPYIIEGYTITNNVNDVGIWIEHTDKPLIIRNCTLNNASIFVNTCSNISVYQNSISLSSLHFVVVKNGSMSQNTISHAAYEGIVIRDTINTSILENTISQSGLFGVDLYRSENNLIVNNTLNYNRYGIEIRSSYHNNLTGNTVSFYEGWGIRILFSDFIRVEDNYFQSTEGNCICIFESGDHIILQNNECNMGSPISIPAFPQIYLILLLPIITVICGSINTMLPHGKQKF